MSALKVNASSSPQEVEAEVIRTLSEQGYYNPNIDSKNAVRSAISGYLSSNGLTEGAANRHYVAGSSNLSIIETRYGR